MLRNIHIRNFALIREADVDFSGGLGVLTGETGSGKSVLVDAVGLALGERAQRDFARNAEESLIELEFEVCGDGIAEALEKLEIEPEDGMVLISRRMQDGRSRFRINGMNRTAAEVRECAKLLIDIHGQSEHQKLLRPEYQLALLDEYGGEEIAAAKEETARLYGSWNALRRELSSKAMDEKERLERMSFLRYEINEIEGASLVEGEDAELEQLYRRLANGRKIAETIEEVHRAAGYEGSGSAGDEIGRALKKLESIADFDEELGELAGALAGIESLLNDFNRGLADYADRLEDEPASLEETEERLNLVNRLKSRYGKTIREISEGLAGRQKELGELEDYEENRARMEKEFGIAEEKLRASCQRLGSLRRRAAERFSEKASAEFRDLNFARAEFSVEFRDSGTYSAGGTDQIEFVIATNPGDEPRPLRKVVSGGELSRLMLGIRAMFAGTDATGTIIFDEVDTGISGRTAQKAAEKLARLSRAHQVLCISHLPQIAAMADTHYGIIKELDGGAAITRVKSLSPEESAKELARLLGGAEITVNTLNSAREMQEMCRQYKQNPI